MDLFEAIRDGDIAAVGEALAGGADVDRSTIHRITPIYYSIGRDRPDIVRLLLENGANVNSQTYSNAYTPLHKAVLTNEREDVVRLLIERGAEVNSKDRLGQTPLHLAARKGRTQLVKLLLDRGASCTVEDCDGETPEAVARRNQRSEIGELLKRASASNSKEPDRPSGPTFRG